MSGLPVQVVRLIDRLGPVACMACDAGRKATGKDHVAAIVDGENVEEIRATGISSVRRVLRGAGVPAAKRRDALKAIRSCETHALIVMPLSLTRGSNFPGEPQSHGTLSLTYGSELFTFDVDRLSPAGDWSVN